jgi:hypothetical protein
MSNPGYWGIPTIKVDGATIHLDYDRFHDNEFVLADGQLGVQCENCGDDLAESCIEVEQCSDQYDRETAIVHCSCGADYAVRFLRKNSGR